MPAKRKSARVGDRRVVNAILYLLRTGIGAPAELDAAGVAIYADKEAMDAIAPHGRGMLQMAAVFAELERGLIRE
jgi:hypothetical protein